MTPTPFHRPAPARLAVLAPLLLVMLSSAGSAAEDDSRPPGWSQERGFSIGLKFVADAIGASETPDQADPEVDNFGSGLALVGGYSWTPHFHARLTIGSAIHGTSVDGLDVQHSFASFEAHWRFLPARPLCPYIFGSLGGSDVRADERANHVEFSGATAAVGAGLLCGFSRRWVVDFTARLEGVNWNKAEWSRDLRGGGTVRYRTGVEDAEGALRLEAGMLYQF